MLEEETQMRMNWWLRRSIGLPAAAVAVVVLGIALTGCGGSDSSSASGSDASSGGTLRVGTAASPPWVLFDTKKEQYFGPTVTLFEAIGKKLGKKIEYVNTSYATAIASLQTDKFDIIGLPLYPTPERKKAIDFIEWTQSGTCFFVPKDNAKVTSVETLNADGVKIAARAGSAPATQIPKDYPKAKVYTIQTEGTQSPVQEVLSGRADATEIDAPLAYKYTKVYPKATTVPAPDECIAQPLLASKIGMGISKDMAQDTRAQIGQVVQELGPQLQDELKRYSAPEFVEIG
jgi:polar amino acid transport system substrate-binding protein